MTKADVTYEQRWHSKGEKERTGHREKGLFSCTPDGAFFVSFCFLFECYAPGGSTRIDLASAA
jgi:hypothetical protein